MSVKPYTYKDKTFNLILKPVFQTIVENQYILNAQNANNRTLENGTKKGLETDLSPNVLKNSADCTTLELFIQKLYHKIVENRISNLNIFHFL